jgi:hypothetical protein
MMLQSLKAQKFYLPNGYDQPDLIEQLAGDLSVEAGTAVAENGFTTPLTGACIIKSLLCLGMETDCCCGGWMIAKFSTALKAGLNPSLSGIYRKVI